MSREDWGCKEGEEVSAGSPCRKSRLWGGQGSQAGARVCEDVPRLPCDPDNWAGGSRSGGGAGGSVEVGVCTWMCSAQREPSNSSDVPVRSRVDIWASQPGSKCEEGRPGKEGERTEKQLCVRGAVQRHGARGPTRELRRAYVSPVTDATKYKNLQPGEDTGKPGQHHPEN